MPDEFTIFTIYVHVNSYGTACFYIIPPVPNILFWEFLCQMIINILMKETEQQKYLIYREAVRKKLHISRHWPKSWVGLGSFSNFFFLRNCDIYNRRVGSKHSCHTFINSKFSFKICIFPLL